MRGGNRSAGYGFVSFTSAEAAQKAVELLDKKELDGRTVIVEIAKPADQKDKEKKQKRVKRRTGRRGSKSVPGEVSEAEANGEASGDASKEDGAAPASGDAAKPKKKKKAVSVDFTRIYPLEREGSINILVLAQAQEQGCRG